MTHQQLPGHLEAFIDAVQSDPALVAGATAAVGDRTGTEAAQAAAEYYQCQGYTITPEELFALASASKSAAGEELTEEELASISGGWFGPPAGLAGTPLFVPWFQQ
jgi:bacteriocin-like protein